MIKNTLTSILLLISVFSFAQQATEIDPKFVKLPRYANLAAIGAAIPSPTQGTMVYNIDTKTNWYYNGTLWVNTAAGTVPAPLNLTRTTAGVVGDCTICGERITNGDISNPDVTGGNGVMGTASGSQSATILGGSGVYGIGLGYNHGVKGYSDNSYGIYGNSSSGVGGYFSGTYALETSGIIKFSGSGVGTPAAGKVLTTLDNSGYATWQDIVPYFKTLDDPGNLLNLTNIGLGGGGYFRINNSSNNANAVEARTLGSGNAIYGFAQGTAGHAANFESGNSFATLKSTNYENGNAGTFEINNANSGGHTLLVNTNGLGRSGWFQSTNTSNNAATLMAENHGSGQAVYGTNFGGGKAGVFEINNGTNSNIALHAITNGNGPAAYFNINNISNNNYAVNAVTNGTGIAGNFQINNTSSISPAFYSTTNGMGRAGEFLVSNSTQNSDALLVSTNGLGVVGRFVNTNSSNNNPTIRASSNGQADGIYANMTGTGKAGNFQINNVSNSSNSLTATTNGTGKAAYFQGTNALETDGTIKFAGSGVGTIAAGKVLTSDAVGGATWQAIPAVAAPLSLSSTATTLTATSTVGTAANFSSTSGYALITGTGNVGIGTTTPTAKLHVFTTATGTEATFSENNGTGNAIGVKGSVTNVAASGVGVWGTHAGAGKGVQGESNSGIGGYFSSTSGYALVTATGNVGVGTSTPTAKLEVAGQVKIQDGTQGANKILTSDANGLASWQTLMLSLPYTQTGSNLGASFEIINSTNIGSGTTNTAIKGVISNSQSTVNQAGVHGVSITGGVNSYGVLGDATGGNGHGVRGNAISGTGVIGNSTSGNGGNFSSSSGYALITGTGNVGIGTNAPTAKLDVAGFSKLGDDVATPKIKMKKLTGTTAATQGGFFLAPHGVSDLKILSIRVMINYFGNATVTDGFNKDNGYECNAFVDGNGNVRVENKSGNSANILSKPFTVLVIYEE